MISDLPPTDVAGNSQKLPTKYAPQNDVLRLQLNDYLTEHGLTRKELARQMSIGETQVIKYLNGKADFAVEKLENAARAVLRMAEKRALLKTSLFANSVTDLVEGVCQTIIDTDDFGLIHGDAGWGKTSGVEMFEIKFPIASVFTCAPWRRTPLDMVRMLWHRHGSGRIEHGTTRMDALEKMFRGTRRPFIIDDAHLLTRRGLRFWFSFNDLTGCPVIFSGNHEVVKLIRESDQMFSRLGTVEMVELKEKEYLPVAQKIMLQIIGEPVPELEDDAVEVVGQQGHLRTLRKQLALTNLIKKKTGRDWPMCFKAAATKLVKDERLLIHGE